MTVHSSPMLPLAAVAFVPKREQARSPASNEASLLLQTFLQLHGLFSDRSDDDYVHRISIFLNSMVGTIVDAWNGHNGSTLKLPLTCSRVSTLRHVFKNPMFPRGGSNYRDYCLTKYHATILYPNAPLVRDAKGSLVSFEAVWITIVVRPQYGIYIDRPSDAVIMDRERAIVSTCFPEEQRENILTNRAIVKL